MAEKTLNTRIILKHDELATWESSSIILKEGEIALARVNEKKPNGQGGFYTVPTYLMKVGDNKSTFNQLNWVAATAADVYDWAKQSTLPIEITGSGNGVSNVEFKKTTSHPKGAIVVTKVAVEAAGAAATAESNAKSHADGLNTAMDTRVKAIEAVVGAGDVAGSLGSTIDSHITKKIEDLDSAGATAGVGDGLVIGSVSEKDGIISVSTKELTAADIPNLTVSKITDFDSAITGKNYATKTDAQKYANAKDAAIQRAQSAAEGAQETANTAVSNAATAQSKADTADEHAADAQTRVGVIEKDYLKKADKDELQQADAGQVKRIAALEGKISGVTGAMHFKGVVEGLPKDTSSYVDGDVILVGEKEYVVSDKKFVELGDTTKEGQRLTDLETFQKTVTGNNDGSINKALADAKAYTDNLANGAVKTNTTNIANLTKNLSDGTTVAKKAEEATKATEDGAGNTITTFYEKKSDADLVRGRLDVIEGEGEGSVAKALVDAKAYTDTEVKKIHKFTNQDVLDGISSTKVKDWDGEVGAMAKINALGTAAKKNVEFFATSAQGEKADSALQKITTTENQGLKVISKNHIDIDDAVTFVLDCGTSAV